jgi:metal-responsive CopG/Arc/MetJ family transcriptional regulator
MKENRGRPARGWDPLAALRLPRELVKQVDDRVKRNGGSRSAAVRGFIDKGFAEPRSGQ